MPAAIPILLHHGLFGVGQFSIGPLSIKNFPRIDHALFQNGHPVFISTVHPTGSIATRAAQLKRILLEHARTLNNGKLLLVAHSMGGLDARYMISKLGMSER